MKTYVNIGEMLIRGGELLFKSLFLKDSSTFTATVILSLFSSNVFFDPFLMEGLSHYIHFFRSSPSYTYSSSKPILEYMSYQAFSLTFYEWWWLRLHYSEVFST